MLPLTPVLCALALASGDDEDFRREQDLSHLEGEPAPALAVESWIGSEPLDLADLRGKVVVLDFWGTW